MTIEGVYMTNGIAERLNKDVKFAMFVGNSLAKFANCDWGDCCQDDKINNDLDYSVGNGALGVYKDGDEKIWIKADNVSKTDETKYAITVLFPSEY